MNGTQSHLNRKVDISRLQSLLHQFSVEATLPNQSELTSLRGILSANTPIYLSAPPGHSGRRLAEIAKQVRNAGFEPVPHIAARNYFNREDLQDFIERVTGEAGVR